MDKNTVSQLLAETNQLEQRLVQWRQEYQSYLAHLAEFRRWQANFTYQMGLHKEHLRTLKAIHTDLHREAQPAALLHAPCS